MIAKAEKSRILGGAFLLQAITSFTCGVFLQKPLIVDGNASETLANIAKNPLMARADIVGEVVTAMGIIFLGAALYATLRKKGEIMALTAFGLYILEGALLAASRVQEFSLLNLSQGYAGGYPESVLTLAGLAQQSLRFEFNLAMLAFCGGGLMFYYLLDKARLVPRALSLWGLIAAVPVTFATGMTVFGITAPFALYAAYVPFEFAIGLWISIKGIAVAPEIQRNSGLKKDPVGAPVGG